MNFVSVFLILSGLVLSSASGAVSLKTPIKKAIDTTGTIYEDLSESKIKTYYGDINVGDKGETLLNKLDTILKRDIRKCNYTSGSSKNSTAWSGYYLYERNWELSPLEESELSGSYKTSGIYINQLYCKSPLYIENKINNGNYKYQNNSGTWVTDTFVSSSKQIDREHVFAKSYGFNGGDISYENLTVGCDPHNLHAGEHQGNSAAHNNLPYGIVVNKNASTSTAYTSKMTGENVGYTGLDKNGIKVYEPPEQDKGDIARTMFYMAACYHKYDEHGGTDIFPALKLTNDSDTTKTKDVRQTQSAPAEYGQLDALLEWHVSDPVNDFEIHRNNLIYNAVGYNRNPFVDYPDWAFACFAPNDSEGANFNNLNHLSQDDKDLKINIPDTYKQGSDIKIQQGTNIIPQINATFLEAPISFKLINNADNSQITDTSSLSNGTYSVHFEVTYNSEVHRSNNMKLLVTRASGNVHDLAIELGENAKLKYSQFEKFDPQGIKVLLDDSETSNYKLVNAAGEQMTSEYTFVGVEKMKIHAEVVIDDELYVSNEFEITIEFSIIQIIIVGAVILLILIIIIIVASTRKGRKKKSNQAKKFENVIKKTNKAIKNSKKYR